MRNIVMRAGAVAVAAAAALAVPATSASALGASCQGTAVKKCVSLSMEYGVWQAEGVVTDVGGDGIQVDVRVDEVRIQVYRNGFWSDVMSSNDVDADGWHGFQDTGLSLRRSCYEFRSLGTKIRAKAHMQWRGDRNGDTWVTGAGVAPVCG